MNYLKNLSLLLGILFVIDAETKFYNNNINFWIYYLLGGTMILWFADRVKRK